MMACIPVLADVVWLVQLAGPCRDAIAIARKLAHAPPDGALLLQHLSRAPERVIRARCVRRGVPYDVLQVVELGNPGTS